MKNIKKTTLITLALLISNGCSKLFNDRQQGHFTSQVSLHNLKLNSTVTKDMIGFIKNHYPISKTTFYFQLDSSAYEEGVTIEDSLRNVGYGISYVKKKSRIPFAYKIDFIAKDIMRTTYNIGAATLSRLYEVRGQDIKAMSPFTARGFKQRIYQNSSKDSYSSVKRAIVSIPVLNIRNSPSSKGKITGKYYKNALVYVEAPSLNSKGEKWSRVVQKDIHNKSVSSNSQNEYIASRYINYIN